MTHKKTFVCDRCDEKRPGNGDVCTYCGNTVCEDCSGFDRHGELCCLDCLVDDGYAMGEELEEDDDIEGHPF
jgi:hypothetical protein